VVRDALINQYGFDPQRFAVRGYGPDRPIAPNTTARNLSLNRRTEIILLPSFDKLSTAALFDPPEVTYTLMLTYAGNFPAGEGTIFGAEVFDALPHGLEYRLGSSLANGQPVDDPELMLGDPETGGESGKGSQRLLRWALDRLRPGDAIKLQYTVEIAGLPEFSELLFGDTDLRLASLSSDEAMTQYVAQVDSTLRDSNYRDDQHLWENRAWFGGLRAGTEVRTDAAGADLELAFERTIEPITIIVEDVLFDTGKARLRPEAFGVLDPAAEIIRSRPGCKVRIEGHCDIRPINTAEFPSNQELSEGRAQAVRDYLVNIEKLDGSIFRTRGFGPRRPIADNETAAGRQKNRRVEIIISGDKVKDQSFKPIAPGKRPGTVKVDLR
jgi:flagellar motor protein MotB